MMNKRKHERLPVRQLKNKETVIDWPHRVLNISESGCAVESVVALGNEEGQINFDLPLPTKTNSVTLTAKIVWEANQEEQEKAETLEEDSSYQYGLSFGDMDKVSKLILDAYLDFLRRDVHIARLDLALQKLKAIKEKIDVSIAYEEKKKITMLH